MSDHSFDDANGWGMCMRRLTSDDSDFTIRCGLTKEEHTMFEGALDESVDVPAGVPEKSDPLAPPPGEHLCSDCWTYHAGECF